MPVTLSDLIEAIQLSRDTFNGWFRRGLISDSLPPTTKGAARVMTRRASLELAFMAALVDCGSDVAYAATMAREFALKEEIGELGDMLVIDPASGRELFYGPSAMKMPLRDFFDHNSPDGLRCTRLNVIHLGGLVAIVNGLFAGQEPD
jgi:hypothetical protein